MKTLVFCTCFINESNEHRIDRYTRWINYYKSKVEYLNSSHLFLIDDGSKYTDLGNDVAILDPNNLPSKLTSTINLVHFKDNLGRSSQIYYTGWWRGFTYSIILAEKYSFKKIIHIESDFFIVSKKLFDYISLSSNGWISLYSRFHNFPESAIQVICQDNFKKFKNIYKIVRDNRFKIGVSAELYLPFTLIEKTYIGDRFGQLDVFDDWVCKNSKKIKLDYIGQILPDHEAEDFKPYFDIEFNWQ